MALLFGGTASDRVDVADSVSLRNLTAGTYACWVYLTGTGVQRFLQKGTSGAANFRLMGVDAGPILILQVARATSPATATASAANFSAWGTSKWVFVAGVHDTGGTSSSQKLFVGDLSTLAAEPSAYAIQALGAGATGDNTSATQVLGANGAGTNNSVNGRIAVAMIFSRALTLAELQSIQFRPRPLSGCVGYWIFGNTTGTQADYSGNANVGTVAGATVADHIPQPSAFAFDFPAGQTASQTITPVGLTAEEHGGSQVVSPGVVTVTLAGILTSADSGTATLSLSVAPTGVSPAEALGITSTVPDAATISPAGIPSNGLEGAATVTPGAVTITPTGIPTSADNGIAAVTPSITVAGLPTTEALGAQTITIDASVLLVGVDMLHAVSDRARYAHAVSDEG